MKIGSRIAEDALQCMASINEDVDWLEASGAEVRIGDFVAETCWGSGSPPPLKLRKSRIAPREQTQLANVVHTVAVQVGDDRRVRHFEAREGSTVRDI